MEELMDDCNLFYCIVRLGEELVASKEAVEKHACAGCTGVMEGTSLSLAVRKVKQASRFESGDMVFGLRLQPSVWIDVTDVASSKECKKGMPLHFKVVTARARDDHPRGRKRGFLEMCSGDLLEDIEKQAQSVRKNYLCHPEFLWDSASALFLPALSHPTLSHRPKEKLFVGRKGAQKLYDEVNRLKLGESLLVLGAKGSGKSTVAEAIAGHLIASGKHAVYMCLKDLEMVKEDTLLGALLLAFLKDEPYYSQLKNLASWDDMLEWCKGKIGPLYFFIDDWELNDKKLEELSACFRRHILVKVSSTNSEEHRVYMNTDKPREKYGSICYFDGPYTAEELETWIANSDLANEFKDKDRYKLTELYGHVDYWTGRMPRLLEKFADAKGDEEKMKMEMTFYVNRMEDFINAAVTKNDLLRCLIMISKGDYSCDLRSNFQVESACFYQDESKLWHPLCPYLQRVAEIMILNKAGLLERKLQLDDIRTWAQAVSKDIQRKENPARLGWNVEDLVVQVLKYLQRVFNDSFQTCITYKRGQEADAFQYLSLADRQKGILLVPESFNETAVDIIYLIFSNGCYIVKAIQISVAKWKAKLQKGSHNIWKEKIMGRIRPALVGAKEVKESFIYLMPESVGKHHDEGDGDFTKRSFKEIDPCLQWMDDELNLPAPDQKPLTLQQCQGFAGSGEQCKIQRKSGAEFFYCRHHQNQEPGNVAV